MTERGVIFSPEEVRAFLAGRKTQFRRPIAVVPKRDGFFAPGRSRVPDAYGVREGVAGHHPRPDGATKNRAQFVVYLLSEMGLAWRPYGGSPDVPWPAERIGEVAPYPPGSRIWVRETWQEKAWSDAECAKMGLPDAPRHHSEDFIGVRLRAIHRVSCSLAYGDPGPWKPSIHMPRWASRITLRVTDVRVERLQDISEGDARAEGVITECEAKSGDYHGDLTKHLTHNAACHIEAYERIWDRLYGKRSPWSSDPWVWAHTVKVLP